jgi:transcriptional regulator with XRE-family HTH domain
VRTIKQIQNRVNRLKRKYGLTQKLIADKTGVSAPMISKIMKGERTTRSVLDRMDAYLDTIELDKES